MKWWRSLLRALERLVRRRSQAGSQSTLGFTVRLGTYTGAITPEHLSLADRWWQELMTDLQAAGYAPFEADPQNVHAPVNLVLDQPADDRDYIDTHPDLPLVGGWYSGSRREIHVPGNYPTTTTTARPASQALKHEFTHHLLRVRFAERDPEHQVLMPNGENIWSLQWRVF